MANTFYYLRGALGDARLLETHEANVNRLLTGDYTQKNIEKLTGHNVYSLRTGNNNAGRLLFTTTEVADQNYLLALEYLPTHDYKKSRFLKSGVLRHYLESQAAVHTELVFDAADSPLPEPILNEAARFCKPLDYYQDQMIELSVSQDEALNLSLPAVISGVAGSGKSCLALSLLASFVSARHDAILAEDRKPRVLYVTEKTHLVERVSADWDALPAAQDESHVVDILTYQAVLEKSTSGVVTGNEKVDFSQWHADYTKTQKKYAKQMKTDYTVLDSNTMYQEFRVCSGYTKEEYLALGKRQSLLPAAERKALYKAYEDYLKLFDENEVQAEFYAFPDSAEEIAVYDLIVVDEAQDFSFAALNNLYALSRNGRVVFCMDSHQSLHDELSTRPYLLQQFNASHTTLETTYRCPTNVVLAANKIITLKNALTGGLADKLESKRIEAISEEKKLGSVYLLDGEMLSESDWLAAEKGTDFAVVAEARHHDEACDYFKTDLVFTPEDIKGLEYQVVVAYRLFENPIFIEANRELSILDEGAAEESGMHRAKSGAGHSQYGPAFNRVYTTYTRTQDSLIIFEIDTRDISALLAVLRTIAQKAVPLAETPPETTEADWVEAIKKVFKSGNVNLAQLLFDKHVQSALDFYDFVQEFYAPNPKVEVKQSEQEVVVEAAGGGGFPREEVSEKPTKQPIHQSKVKKTTASKGVSISPKRKTCAQYVVAISEHFNSDDLLANLREALAHFSLSDLLSASFKHATAKKAKSGSIKLIDFIKEDLDRITLFFSCLEKKEIVKKVDVLALRKQLKLDVMNKKKEAETKKILTLKLRSFEEVQRVDLFLKGDTMPLKEQFFIAAERNDEAMLEASLIGNTFDMNTLSPNGATALLLAAQNGHEGIVRRLLACDGVDVNKEMEGILITPLYVATQNRHVNIVEALLQHKDIKVDKVNSQGATALYIAAQNGYEELVELLLSHHAQINWAGVQGVTPLLIAVTNGRERVVRLLCSNEAIDMNASDQNKSTPLYIAVQTGNLAFVRFFLAHKKIQVNQFKDQGVKILDMALLYGYVDIARLLFAHKDIPHQRFKDQDIHFLCRAAENGQVDVLRLLFSEYKDIDINACNRKGLTALCCAVRGGHEAVVEMLLSVKGIDVYARDEHFQTACDKAREAGHGGIEMKLLEAERAFRSCSAFDIPASPSGFFSQSTAAAADEPLHCVDYDSGSSDNGLFKS